MNLGAVILCGGQSRRMGRPKAWLPFGGEFLLQRITRIAAEACSPIVVVAAPDQELPNLPDHVLITRDPVSHRGPLQGIAAGLAALPIEVDLAYATATDAPFLVPAWVRRLSELIGDADLAIPKIAGFLQPMAALYRRANVRPAAERLLAADRLRPVFLADEVATRVVEEHELRGVDPLLQTLHNLNTPLDHLDAGLQWQHATRNNGRLPIVVVELYGVPRLRAERDRAIINAATVHGVVKGLARECPALVGPVIADDRLHPAYRFCLEGREFLHPDLTVEAVKAGSTLILLAADAGG